MTSICIFNCALLGARTSFHSFLYFVTKCQPSPPWTGPWSGRTKGVLWDRSGVCKFHELRNFQFKGNLLQKAVHETDEAAAAPKLRQPWALLKPLRGQCKGHISLEALRSQQWNWPHPLLLQHLSQQPEAPWWHPVWDRPLAFSGVWAPSCSLRCAVQPGSPALTLSHMHVRLPPETWF